MIIFELIQQLKTLRHLTVSRGWISKNKAKLFAFVVQNPIRRFKDESWSERVRLSSVSYSWVRLAAPMVGVVLILTVLGFNNFLVQASTPGSLTYSMKLWSENINCLLASDSIKKINCQINQAERRLAEVQAMLELRGVGVGREAFEMTLQAYVDKLKNAEINFVRLAAVEEDPALILEAAKQLERAKTHQELITTVETQAGSGLEDALQSARRAAVGASAQADKQLVRVEAATAEDGTLTELPSVQELDEEFTQTNLEILNLETILLTLKSYHGYVVLLAADNLLSQARVELDQARRLFADGSYIEAVDVSALVSNLIIEAKAEIKKVEPNLNLNL
jgi:hypothetical protein